MKVTEPVRSYVTVPEREHLERVAEQEERSVAAVIRRAIRAYLSAQAQTGGKS